MRDILITAVILLQLLLGYFYNKDYNNCCTGTITTSAISEEILEGLKLKPLTFRWQDSIALTADGWISFKDSIIKALGPDKTLHITSAYYDGEGSEALALARIRSVKALFSELPENRISFDVKNLERGNLNIENNFEAVTFSSNAPESKIKVEATKTLIYFGSNSVEKLNSTEVSGYLDEVAERVIKSGAKIILTGHTDNVGSEDLNLGLGMKRAETVKKYLVSKGVPESSVTIGSKGEAEPIGDNKTEEGRAKNRRTELTIIQ